VAVDHKTVWDFYTIKDSRLQPQLPKYVGMLRFLGQPVEYGIYNMIRSRRLMGDKMLKSQLSEALGEPENTKLKVVELEAMAEERGIVTRTPPLDTQLYDTLPVPMSDARISQTLQEQFDTAEEIIELDKLTVEQRDRKSWRVANKMVCNGCSFRELCDTELAGEDTTLVLEEYQKRDPRELPPLDGEDDE
jgi:hypothetical protein